MAIKYEILKNLGLALLIIGALLFMGGAYNSSDECVSGTALTLEPVDSSNESISNGDVVSFGELSPVEQWVFLEAYTNKTGYPYASKPYSDWIHDQFNGDTSAPQIVTYRDRQFEVTLIAVDCSRSMWDIIQPMGTAASILGIVAILTFLFSTFIGKRNE